MNKINLNKIKSKNKRGKQNKKLKNNKTKDSKSYMMNNSNKKLDNKGINSLNKEKNNNGINNEKDFETDYEFNNASYIEARKYDKRSGCEYYYSLLKSNQIFIFTFLTFDDYNSGIIKKYIFFLSFALHYAINALFFTDSNMHQIFKDQGSYNIKYQFLFIFCSSFISIVLLRIALITLVLTDKNIVEIKNQPNLIHANMEKKKTLRNMIIKFGIFFGFNLIILVLSWYYLTCWNAIYQNTKIYLIKNTFISFGISFVYPFFINIIPTILRMQSLKKNKREYLYNVSKIVQIL